MKKVLLFGAVILFTAGAFVVSSCDDDNPVSCAQKLVDVSNAQSAYLQEDSYANCVAYKEALEDYINCDGIADKEIYQGYLEDLTCIQ